MVRRVILRNLRLLTGSRRTWFILGSVVLYGIWFRSIPFTQDFARFLTGFLGTAVLLSSFETPTDKQKGSRVLLHSLPVGTRSVVVGDILWAFVVSLGFITLHHWMLDYLLCSLFEIPWHIAFNQYVVTIFSTWIVLGLHMVLDGLAGEISSRGWYFVLILGTLILAFVIVPAGFIFLRDGIVSPDDLFRHGYSYFLDRSAEALTSPVVLTVCLILTAGLFIAGGQLIRNRLRRKGIDGQ